jgi:hypothetical protein
MSSWWPTCHISIRLAHMSAQHGMIFLDETQNGALPHGHRKPLPLGYCFSFVVVRVIISLYYILGC